jgi:osmoprotectant transport system ATP-binding protein
MVEPTRGKISWDGSPVRSRRKTALRRQMGYVSQRGGLFPHRTVVENIQTVPGLLGWSPDRAHKRSYELLARVGLERSLAHKYPAQLTASQQQRVAIARALAGDPKVLLLDEPFAAVDSLARSELHQFLIGLQGQTPKTIVLVTDDVDEALKLGDQVAILRVGGRLAQVGTPQHLLDEPADAFVDGYLGRDRGYRSLSFVPASALALDRINVVRDVDAAAGGEPTLMVDREARPIGWADREHPGQVFPLGSTFHHDTDTLRVALDSALSSPFSLAVAVSPDTGRFAGVTSAEAILAAVQAARVASAESISVRDAAAQRPDRPVGVAAPEPVASESKTEPADDTTVTETETESVETESVESEPATVEPATVAAAAVPVAETPPTETHTAETQSAVAVEQPAAPEPTAEKVDEVDEASVTTRIERAVAVADEPEPEAPPEEVAAPYPYDQGEYDTEGGHGDSADDAANAEDPDSDVDLDTFDRDLDRVDDRDPVR